MDLNALRAALQRRPFKPFIIRLADGRSEPVKHPEFVAVGHRLAVVIREDNSSLHIEPLMIVSLDYEGPSKQRGGNGSTKKRRPGA